MVLETKVYQNFVFKVQIESLGHLCLRTLLVYPKNATLSECMHCFKGEMKALKEMS